MKLSDVAQAIGMPDPTVSRAAGREYLPCDCGVFPMPYLLQRKAAVRAFGI